MQHPVADKHFELPVVPRHRHVNRDFLARIFQIPVQAVFQRQLLGCNFKSRFRGLIDIQFILFSRAHYDLPVSPSTLVHPPATWPAPLLPYNLTLIHIPGSVGQYTNTRRTAQEKHSRLVSIPSLKHRTLSAPRGASQIYPAAIALSSLGCAEPRARAAADPR